MRQRVPAVALAVLLAAAAASVRCDSIPECPDAYCGACRTLVEGDVSVSGDLRVDGHLVAAHAVETGTSRRSAAFGAAVVRLAAAHGLPVGDVTTQYVEDLLRVVAADVALHLDGPLRAVVRGSICAASSAVAADAQVRCERAAGCEPQSADATLAFACDGRCLGMCDGECSGPLACGLTAPPGPCDGTCDGSCALAPPGPCAGRCLGACGSDCSLLDPTGACMGRCDGDCDGACVLDLPGPCAGTCHGTCWVEPQSEACTGASECRGQCDGQCSGRCQGTLTPSANASDCEATAACQAQAAAQSLAALDCSPAAVHLDLDLDPGLDADARAAFVERLGLLEATGEAALETAAFFELLVAGRADGVEVVMPVPIERIATGVAEALPRARDGGLVPPPGRDACIEPALTKGAERLVRLADTVASTRQAQRAFVDFLYELP
jgi:hypothetical protein